MSDDRCEYDYALACPLCGRTAEGADWPTHPDFGYRFCPRCVKRGLGRIIPRKVLVPKETT